MKDVIGWILNHWDVVSSCGLLLLSVVFFLLKKKPTNDILSYIYEYCVKAVKVVENNGPVDGLKETSETKLKRAVNIVFYYLDKVYPGNDFSSYRDLIISIIEKILETPQKKESEVK